MTASTIRVSPLLLETASLDPAAVLARLATREAGLTTAEASTLLETHGPNVLARDERPSFARLVVRAAVNPLVILLACLLYTSDAADE